jgi:hypothetical protein
VTTREVGEAVEVRCATTAPVFRSDDGDYAASVFSSNINLLVSDIPKPLAIRDAPQEELEILGSALEQLGLEIAIRSP